MYVLLSRNYIIVAMRETGLRQRPGRSGQKSVYGGRLRTSRGGLARYVRYCGRLTMRKGEIMPMTEELVRLIEGSASHSVLREAAVRSGMVELTRAGLQQAIDGVTTLEEVYFKTKT